MATLSANNYGKMIAVPMEQIPAGHVSGKQRIAYDEITLAAELAVNDIINCCAPIPANARIINAFVKAGAMGAGVTAKLGIASNDSYFIAAASIATAAKLSMANEAGFLAQDSVNRLQPIVTIAGAGSSTATGKTIEVAISWILE
jgi:hypothetical protein